MRRGRWLPGALMLALAVSGPAPAQTAPGPGPTAESDARARLAQPAVLSGRFEQNKQLRGFRNPLVSRGGFLLLRERGVAWDTTEPFASSTVLTRERLLTRLPDGSTRVVFDAAASPGIAAVNSLLMALVAGDLDALAPQFDISESPGADGGWRLVLAPRGPELRRVFRHIELRGDRHVQEVHIEEASGDRTLIRFLDMVERAAPTAEEAARFD